VFTLYRIVRWFLSVSIHPSIHTHIYIYITNKELRNTIMYPEFLAVDTTGDTNIEDRMLMIVAGLETMRRNFSSLWAFLPSECQWVFHFHSLMFSQNFLDKGPLGESYCDPVKSALLSQCRPVTIARNLTIVTQLSQHACANVAQSVSYEFLFFVITICVISTRMETSKFVSASTFWHVPQNHHGMWNTCCVSFIWWCRNLMSAFLRKLTEAHLYPRWRTGLLPGSIIVKTRQNI
jgi:hypothetical protein